MLLSNILLALAWTALQGQLSTVNLVVGYAFGYVVLRLLTRGGVLPAQFAGKVGTFFGLLAYLIWELVLANVRLTLDILRWNLTIRPGVIRVPLDIKSDGEILLLSALINLTPGSVMLDVSDDRQTIYVHVMHMKDPDTSRREIKDGFERRVQALFR